MGVPQGSVLGSYCFCIYILQIGNIIQKHAIRFHIYVDDIQVYVGFKPDDAEVVLQKLEKCIEEIHDWMTAYKLKLNNGKTQCMYISSKNMLKKLMVCPSMLGPLMVHLCGWP